MKANQSLRTMQSDNNAFVGVIIGMLVIVLIGSSVITIIANNSQVAEDSADTDSKTDSIIDLWPFGVAIAILLYIFVRAM